MPVFEPTISTRADGPLAPVLVVDFRPFGVTTTLTDLVAGVPDGHTVYGADPVTDLADYGRSLELDQLAGHYADQVRRRSRLPGVVAAYCSAASVAVRIARRLGEIPVVLVDPTWVGDAEVQDSVSSVRVAFDLPPTRPNGIGTVAAIMEELTLDLDHKLIADEIADDERELMLAMLEQQLAAWFGFLLATRAAPVPQPDRVSIITSEAGGRGPAPAWANTGVPMTYLPGTPTTLLTEDRLRRMIISASDAPA